MKHCVHGVARQSGSDCVARLLCMPGVFLCQITPTDQRSTVPLLQAEAGAAPGPAADVLKPSAPQPADGASGGKGWAVLREGGAGSGLGLAGVPGSGVRMRDWDTRAGSSDEEAAPDGLGLGAAGVDDDKADSGSDSGDGGW